MQEVLLDAKEHVARLLLETKAAVINVDNLFQFASGMLSPVYIDNRKLISFPETRNIITNYLIEMSKTKVGLSKFDIIGGIATGGIPWAAWLADRLNLPLIYIRPTPKHRGTKQQIEGAAYPEQRILMMEDLITTGLSSSNAIQAVRANGGIVDYCIAIFSFGAPSARERFGLHKTETQALTDLTTLLRVGREQGYLDNKKIGMVENWVATTLISHEI